MMKELALSLARRFLSSPQDDYTFYKFRGLPLGFSSGAGLYLHIPFCLNNCPYCPYYKVPYQEELALAFKEALIKEIKLYSQSLKTKKFETLYIGGGSPLLMIKELPEIVSMIKKHFYIDGYWGIEVHPNNIDGQTIEKIKKMGFSLVSLGGQSFQPSSLHSIGRNYSPNQVIESLKILKSAGFRTVNLDLMFVLPGQTLSDLKADLRQTVELGVDQITCYPLFTFPFSAIGRFKKLKKVRLPNLIKRKRMYYFIHEFLTENNYQRSSVWSFSLRNRPSYSSVTRDNYLGFGPSAASYDGRGFYFNTFSVSEYIKTLKNNKPPSAIKMSVTCRMEKLFWLYWRLYETYIPKLAYQKKFKCSFEKDFGKLFSLFKRLGFIKSENNKLIILNQKGSHWIHLIQNYYALRYVDKIWSVCYKNPWPDKIRL